MLNKSKMYLKISKIFSFIILTANILLIQANNEFCSIDEDNFCVKKTPYRYILYDINPPEGFNLRRDVYMRLAVFVHNLQKSPNENLRNFKLVLPPWSNLYHWRSKLDNFQIPWNKFFDLDSLRKFAPVIEMYEFFNEIGTNYGKINIDEVYILQHFEDMFKSGKFEDKYEIDSCTGEEYVTFYEYQNLTSNNIKCLSFHGHASLLTNILENSTSRTFLFHHAEIVLHDRYGDQIYWQARRSMRFNKQLYAIANEFRAKYLDSTDQNDNTYLPDDWTRENMNKEAKGGPYLSVHLRRRDFVRGHSKNVPSLDFAAKQIKKLMKKYNLANIFIATDAPKTEFEIIRNRLSPYNVVRFKPTEDDKNTYKDGGIAIIEQIICAHAVFFIGTYESTFTFRIQEEREILGFPYQKTFNRLCGDDPKTVCDKPSVWKIIY